MNASLSRFSRPAFRQLASVALLVFLPGLIAAEPAKDVITFRTDTARFSISGSGAITKISSATEGENYIAPEPPSPVLTLRLHGEFRQPNRAEWNAVTSRLRLDYGEAYAIVEIQSKPTHLVLTVVEVQPPAVDVALWGPYATKIGEIIGDTVGVVRNDKFALGLQALNSKTLGGYPEMESDVEQGRGGDDRGHYTDLAPELNQGQSFRGDTARSTPFGSVLQAYTRDRSTARVIPNWGHERFVASAFADGGVIGSRIALFACPAPQALQIIGEIELAEGLPHPMIDGVWGKISPTATASYLIVDFGESTIERAIDMAKRAGLKYIYHSSPFETWGHFRLKTNAFPHGWDGLRQCVEKGREAGIRVGVHTLSNFITPNDAYVTPRPDARLAKIGASALATDVDSGAKELAILAPDYFTKKTELNTVMVDQELIRYSSISTNEPWRLLDCQRGAWGTRPERHGRGAPVAKLMDHSYKVFLTDAELSQEVGRNLAMLFNETGCLQLSFDGLEGNWSTGLGQYGTTLFPKSWYDALSPELRGRVINDASLPGHFNWHMNTRMNWGEPWYAGFRESQTLYRFKNQVYFERNYLPRMLGWFALRGDTSVEDIEWMLARAAGYHAGFGLATSLASTAQLAADPASADSLQKFGATPAILQAIQTWETARLGRAFNDEVRARLRDNAREFHLERSSGGDLELAEVTVFRFNSEAARPKPAEFSFAQPRSRQAWQWILRSDSDKDLNDISLGVDGQTLLASSLPQLARGTTLKYAGGPEAIVFDANWREKSRIPVSSFARRLSTGPHQLQVRCAGSEGAKMHIELRFTEDATQIPAAKTK